MGNVAITDADGLGPFSYQWRANGVAIPSATGPNHLINAADLDRALSVAVSYTDGYGQLETVVSTTGTAGNDLLPGNALNDTLCGALGNDTLLGYAGDDLLIGGDGLDVLQGGDGSGLYVMEVLKDHLAAVAVTTATFALNINAAAAPNALTIIGNGGRNTLIGSAFADVLDGRAGAGVLQGNSGDDTFLVDNVGDAITVAAARSTAPAMRWRIASAATVPAMCSMAELPSICSRVEKRVISI